MNIAAITYWIRYQYYKIEATLTFIFADDGRRYKGDIDEQS